MNALSHKPPLDDRARASAGRARWVLGIVVALAMATGAGVIVLHNADAEPILSARADPVPGTSGPQLQHDHSVVLTQDLPDDHQAPGASIAAYSAP